MQIFTKVAIVASLTLLLSASTAMCQSIGILEDGFYCVVGTFRFINNAVAYRQSLAAQGFSARIAKDKLSDLYYIHLGKAPNKEGAISSVLTLRQKSEFKDCWVKTVGQTLDSFSKDSSSSAGERILMVQPIVDLTALETPPKILTTFEVSNTEVFLHLYNVVNDKMVEGTVEIIDTERSRLIEKVNGNTYYVLPDPKSKSKRITMIGDVFGYRKVQTEISYPIAAGDTLNPNLEMVGTIVMIRFDMARYVKGDIHILYNVYFYNDAAVMQPESKYELNKLLEMMEENPRYKIRLHGHCNGNYTGKFLFPADITNLFSLNSVVENFGTAKTLASRRAEVIKEFLVTSGIAGDRIEIKSWGGKKPLHDRNSANAKKNLRVEVEILEQ